jgi:hypothetical protein
VGPAGEQINAWITEILLRRSVDLSHLMKLATASHVSINSSSKSLCNILERVGFSQVDSECISVPTGTWGGEVGKMSLRCWLSLFRGLEEWMDTEMGVCKEELDSMLNRWTREVEQESWWELVVCVARK